MSRNFTILPEYQKRPSARGDAWVYSIQESEKFWGVLVDEEIRHKTLFAPGSELHSEIDEIIVPLEGRYWVKVGDWSRTLSPGEMAIIPHGTPHDSGIATNLVGTHFLVLLLHRRLGVLDGVSPGGIRLPGGTTSWLRGAFRFLRQTCNSESFIPLHTLPQFLTSCARTGERLTLDATHPDPFVTRLLSLLEQIPTPKLDDLAREFSLSPTHLQRRFRQALGTSPLHYARAWKLDAIAARLRSGDTLPLVELAVEYDFGDMKHFRELFHRRFGASPSAYRKNPPPGA